MSRVCAKKSDMPPVLVVLAAGMGSRYGEMKQLAEVGPGGEGLMDYAVYDALRVGFDRVVLVVSESSRDPVRAHAEAGLARFVDTHYAEQASSGRGRPWGTGHAVLAAQPFVDGAFGVINADDYYGLRSLALLSNELSRPGADNVLVGYILHDTLSEYGGVSRGVCDVDGDKLISVTELHDVRRIADGLTSRERNWRELTGDEVISTNLWGFHPTFFAVLDESFSTFRAQVAPEGNAEFLIGTAVTRLIERGGAVRVLKTSDRFFGVTFRADLPAVRQQIADLIAQGHYPEHLWE
ncbi:MAG: NTP transferase domain-containing protein [Actinobacteria bacterium]|nr:NTP transferase domain-containing protein [Actinomycetota bacterium]